LFTENALGVIVVIFKYFSNRLIESLPVLEILFGCFDNALYQPRVLGFYVLNLQKGSNFLLAEIPIQLTDRCIQEGRGHSRNVVERKYDGSIIP